jgi:CheY-like chemotaxis protein
VGALTAGRVLLAEDDADLRRLLALTLRRAGHEVLEAADGREALALARGARPDVAVLDGRLPGLSGPAVAAALAADPATAGVAVVLASGAPPPAASAGGPPALPGVGAYLEKLFSRAALLARVAQALAAARAGFDPASCASGWVAGHALPPEQAVADALEAAPAAA